MTALCLSFHLLRAPWVSTFLAIVNNAAMDICIQCLSMSLFSVLWGIYRGVKLLDHVVIMAPHSSTLAWKIPQTEEPGRLQSMGSLRVGHD